MLNRVRQSIRTLTATSGHWCCQSVLLAAIGPAISKADGYAVLAVVGLAIVLVAIVILVAIFAAKPARRSAVALAVLDRIFRWKALAASLPRTLGLVLSYKGAERPLLFFIGVNAGGPMSRSMVVGLLATAGSIMAASVGLAHGDLALALIAGAGIASGVAAYLPLPEEKKENRISSSATAATTSGARIAPGNEEPPDPCWVPGVPVPRAYRPRFAKASIRTS